MGVLCSSSRAAPSSLFLCCPCRSPPCAAASTSGRGDPTSGRSPAGLSSSLSSRGRRNFYSSIVVTKNNSSVTFCSPGGFRLLFTCPSCVCVHTNPRVQARTHTVSFPCSPPLAARQDLAFLWEIFRSETPAMLPCCWWEALYASVCLPSGASSTLVFFHLGVLSFGFSWEA